MTAPRTPACLAIACLAVTLLFFWTGCAKKAVSTAPAADPPYGGKAGAKRGSAPPSPLPAANVFGFKSLALLPVEGPYGGAVMESLKGLLPQDLPRIISPASLPALESGVFESLDSRPVLKALRSLGVDGALAARVTGTSRDAQGFEAVLVEEGTGQYKQEKNLFGQVVDVEIKRKVMRPTPFVIREAFVVLDYKIIDVKTGKLAASDSVTEQFTGKFGGSGEYSPSGDKKPSLAPSGADTLTGLSRQAAASLSSRICPAGAS